MDVDLENRKAFIALYNGDAGNMDRSKYILDSCKDLTRVSGQVPIDED